MGKVIDFQTAKKRIIKNKKSSKKIKSHFTNITPLKFYSLLFLVILTFSYLFMFFRN